MKTATIYRERGRLLQSRSGAWLLTFHVEHKDRPATERQSEYVQLRGQRDELIAHAQQIGIRFVYLPKIIGLVPIEYAASMLDEAAARGTDYSTYAEGQAREDTLTDGGIDE